LINYSEPQTNIRKQTTSTTNKYYTDIYCSYISILVNDDVGVFDEYGSAWVNSTEDFCKYSKLAYQYQFQQVVSIKLRLKNMGIYIHRIILELLGFYEQI
jgi:hypothetical protein